MYFYSMEAKTSRLDWVIVDGIGPFFRGYVKRRINWSKIPLAELPVEGERADAFWAGVRQEMREFVERTRAEGYNTVTLDDVAHVTRCALHDEKLAARVERLRVEMKRIVKDIKAAGMRVLMTTDVIPMTEEMRDRFAGCRKKTLVYFKELLAAFFDDFTEVDGVVLRMGEGDGHDVKGDLRSELYVRTAREANQMLKSLLEVFESRGKVLVCRTWTVGAYPIGDLIWHRKRIAELLKGIESPAFILSLKYGESDFFRYLPLNRAFFQSQVNMIIEFQARREYEGAGEYPSFIGWDAEEYADVLREVDRLVGLSVWVQTGGWHAFRRRSYIGVGSPWVELNSRVLVEIFNHGCGVNEAIGRVVGAERCDDAVRLLRRVDEVIKKGLYIQEFAQQKWFFRRVRIPPMIHVYWDCLFLYHPVKKLLSHFVEDKERAIREGYACLKLFPEMLALTEKVGWSVDDIHFMQDTFVVLAATREYYFCEFDETMRDCMMEIKTEYKLRHPRSGRPRYRIKTDFSRFGVSRWKLAMLQRIFVRNKRGYRLVDHVVTLQLLGLIYRLFSKRYRKNMPKFVRKSAMGVDALFK